MTTQEAAWLAESRERMARLDRRIRAQAAMEANFRTYAPAMLPPTDRLPHWPGVEGRLWSDRAVCRDCGRNLRRNESQARPCAACEANPAPLVAEKVPAVDYAGGYKP